MLLCCVLSEWMLLWKAMTLFISIKSLDGNFEATYEVQKGLQKKDVFIRVLLSRFTGALKIDGFNAIGFQL